MTLNLKARAIAIALITFAVLYFCLALFTRVIGGQIDSIWALLLVNVIGWLVWVIPGYLAASLAKTRGVLNGVVVGIGATLLQSIDYFFRSPGMAHEFREHWYLFLIYGVVLSGLGGFAWDIKTIIKARHSKPSAI